MNTASQSKIFPNAYALIVGVGSYVQMPSLPETIYDAKAIAEILVDPLSCGYATSNVELLVGEKADANNFRYAIRNLQEKTNEDSTVFFFFSGHGGRATENGQHISYICLRDANPNNLAQTAISGRELSDSIQAISARRLLVVFDSCYAGGAATLKGKDASIVWKSGLPEAYYEQLSQGAGRVVIASSKEDQVSFIRRGDTLSLFTYYFREAMRGEAAVRNDGLIHVLDVFHYVSHGVSQDEPRQKPLLKVHLENNFPIALAKGGNSPSSKDNRRSGDMQSKRQWFDEHTELEQGLDRMLEKLGKDNPNLNQALIYEYELLENIKKARIYGDPEDARVERRQIIGRLNNFCYSVLGQTFSSLCRSR